MSQELDLVKAPDAQRWAVMPVMDIEMAAKRYDMVRAFTTKRMNAGTDYGIIPGTDKPTLLKPGAEKLCSLFGLTPKFELIHVVEWWNGEPGNPGSEPLFYYRYKCSLWRGDMLVAESEASANSREKKYRYRWVPESEVPTYLNKDSLPKRDGTRTVTEFDWSLEKRETTGKYGKPIEYWQQFEHAIAERKAKRVKKKMKDKEQDAWQITVGEQLFRVPNPDICDEINTLQKMAQKRSLIAGALIACNASEYYGQDLEDRLPDGDHHTSPVGPHELTEPGAQIKEDVVPELADMYAQCGNLADVMVIITDLKADLRELSGEDKIYYQVLKQDHGILDKAAMKRLDADSSRALVRDLYGHVVRLRTEESNSEVLEKMDALGELDQLIPPTNGNGVEVHA